MGKIRKLRPWARWFDRDVRAAQIRHELAMQFQVVDYTDAGVAIKMPVELVPQWEAMDHDTRQAFMADVDRQRFKAEDADALHDWRSHP